jgi:hypothetical protein
MFVVHCVEHRCVGWFWGLESMMGQVLLQVHVMYHDGAWSFNLFAQIAV